jgi:hypothetical protein
LYPLPKLKTSVTLMFPSFLSPWNLLPGRQSMRLAVDIYNHPTSDAVGTPHSPHHRHQRMLHSSGPVTAGSWEPPDNPHRSQLRLTDLDELPQGSFVRRLVVLEVVRRCDSLSDTQESPRKYSGDTQERNGQPAYVLLGAEIYAEHTMGIERPATIDRTNLAESHRRKLAAATPAHAAGDSDRRRRRPWCRVQAAIP